MLGWTSPRPPAVNLGGSQTVSLNHWKHLLRWEGGVSTLKLLSWGLVHPSLWWGEGWDHLSKVQGQLFFADPRGLHCQVRQWWHPDSWFWGLGLGQWSFWGWGLCWRTSPVLPPKVTQKPGVGSTTWGLGRVRSSHCHRNQPDLSGPCFYPVLKCVVRP